MDTADHTDQEHIECRESVLALVRALEKRGLIAEATGNSVAVKNPAGAPDEDEPMGHLLSPGMQQEVICLPLDGDGELWWFWCWTGPERDSPPDLEPICPVIHPLTAAARIARVVEVPFTGPPDGSSQ